MGVVAARNRHPRRGRQLGRQAARGAVARVAGVQFRLRNGFLGHRFAFKAKPSAEIASALDVRGELNALDVGDPGACVGQVYAELEYADLVAWRRWVDYPFDIRSGKGGVRLWLDLQGKTSTRLTPTSRFPRLRAACPGTLRCWNSIT